MTQTRNFPETTHDAGLMRQDNLAQRPTWPSDSTALEACRAVLSHGENFPVLSLLVPRDRVLHVTILYAYCRTVDDLGDEAGGARLPQLEAWERELHAAFRGEPTANPIVRASASSARHLNLPIEPYLQLIEANRRDQAEVRFGTFAEVREYCRHSADPVGRLYLALHNQLDPRLHAPADAICTGLQLVNFLQDVATDLAQRNRIYIAAEALNAYAVDESDLRAGPAGINWQRVQALLAAERQRARAFLEQGLALPRALAGRPAAATWVFAQAGLLVLRALDRVAGDVWCHRPAPSSVAKAALLLRALVWLTRGNGRAQGIPS